MLVLHKYTFKQARETAKMLHALNMKFNVFAAGDWEDRKDGEPIHCSYGTVQLYPTQIKRSVAVAMKVDHEQWVEMVQPEHSPNTPHFVFKVTGVNTDQESIENWFARFPGEILEGSI